MPAAGSALRRATRAELAALPVEVAPLLLGGELRTYLLQPDGDETEVRVRLTEVEAYHGQGTGEFSDPGSHARMGRTARNATMWGEPGHLYVYLSHGIHSCVNVVCGPEGIAGGVLLRAGEIVAGTDAVAHRRGVTTPLTPRIVRDLARGPGRFGQAVGLKHPLHDGIDAVTGEEWHGARAELWVREPVAGTDAVPWRFWIAGDPTVSPFRWGRGAEDAHRLSRDSGGAAEA
jgi:DNA-3-methyladenine glycosylase